MPPKTLPEKSDVIVNTLKYFEALTLIVRIKRQENQLSLLLMKVVTKCIIEKSFLHRNLCA